MTLILRKLLLFILGDVGGVVEEQINDGLKVYGWRSTTQEDTYKKQPGVLIGNWVEEQADLQFRKRIPPLPSDVSFSNLIWNQTR